MTVSNGDVLKVFLELVLADGTMAQNVFHLRSDFADDQNDGDVSTAVEGYLEAIYGELNGYLTTDFTINPSWLHKTAWDPVGAEWAVTFLIDIFTPSFAHADTADPFPNQIAPVIVGNTYEPRSRGRKFLMGFVEDSALAGNLVAAAVVEMAAATVEYISQVVISSGNVLTPGVVDEDANLFRPFRDGAANSIVGTQRRRKPGVGT